MNPHVQARYKRYKTMRSIHRGCAVVAVAAVIGIAALLATGTFNVIGLLILVLTVASASQQYVKTRRYLSNDESWIGDQLGISPADVTHLDKNED